MARRYAEDTDVAVSKSKTELESLLRKQGATAYGYAEQGGVTAIQFELHGRRYLFRLEMPAPDAREVTHKGGYRRTPAQQQAAWEQIERQRWRALILIVKAKLESIAQGVETPEQAFMAQLMLPDGHTVGEWVSPQVEQIYESNLMPSLLPGVDPGRIPLALSDGRRG